MKIACSTHGASSARMWYTVLAFNRAKRCRRRAQVCGGDWCAGLLRSGPTPAVNDGRHEHAIARSMAARPWVRCRHRRPRAGLTARRSCRRQCKSFSNDEHRITLHNVKKQDYKALCAAWLAGSSTILPWCDPFGSTHAPASRRAAEAPFGCDGDAAAVDSAIATSSARSAGHIAACVRYSPPATRADRPAR